MEWQADWQGIVRTGVAYDDNSRRYSLLYRGEKGGLPKTVDRADGRKREGITRPFMFLPGTDHALTIHSDDKDHGHIYETDLQTLQDVKTVFSAPEGTSVNDAWVARDEKTLLGAVLDGPHGKMAWIDPALATLQGQFDKAVGDRTAEIISLSADRSKMLVRVSRPDNPGALYFYSTAVGSLSKIAAFNDALGNRRLAPIKWVKYKARDGLEIEAVLTLPKDRDPHNLPIVMLPHGGPWAYDSVSYDYWAQFIASLGYAVMQPNFRGSTGYGMAFERKGEGQMGLAMQDDISDGLKWAADQGIADAKRACIVGASYGGYAAMWGIIKDPDQFKCSISIAGVSNVRKDVNSFDDLYAGIGRDAWKRMAPDVAAVSPINGIDKIKTPLLLIHGKKDVRVDYRQSTNMADKMRSAGKAVDMVLLPEADHHFGRQADRETLLGTIQSFLTKHNPAK